MPVRGADDKVKSPSIAGTYAGVVKDDQAVVMLKADGTMTVRPKANNKDFVLSGTWKRNGNRITAKLTDPDGEEGTLFLRVDGGDLVLEKVIEPGGDETQFSPPLFALKKKGPGKAPAGVYEGTHDGDELRVTLKDNRTLTVKPTDPDADAEATLLGKWKPGKEAGTLALELDGDNGLLRVMVKIDGAGMHLLKLEKPDGEVETFTEARLKRVKAAPKKDAQTSPNGAAQNGLALIRLENSKLIVEAFQSRFNKLKEK